jgi:hypothetical protein
MKTPWEGMPVGRLSGFFLLSARHAAIRVEDCEEVALLSDGDSFFPSGFRSVCYSRREPEAEAGPWPALIVGKKGAEHSTGSEFQRVVQMPTHRRGVTLGKLWQTNPEVKTVLPIEPSLHAQTARPRNSLPATETMLRFFQDSAGVTDGVPLNAVALSAFKELKARTPKSPWVFLNKNGEKLRGSRDWFEPTVEAAGVKEYTWHCNRHTFASRLVMAGVDLRTVAQLMGHRTIQMTMRYAHLAPDHQQNAVERLVKSGNGAESRRRQSATRTATTSGDRP